MTIRCWHSPGNLHSVSMTMVVRVGSIHESSSEIGCAHFLEHFLFRNIPNIADQMTGIGAEYNAFTGKEHTGFDITCSLRCADTAASVMKSIIFSFPDVTTEIGLIDQKIVMAEMNMLQLDPMHVILSKSSKIVNRGTEYARSVGGSLEDVAIITEKTLHDFYQKHYKVENMLLIVSGGGEHFDVRKLCTALGFPKPIITTITNAPQYTPPTDIPTRLSHASQTPWLVTDYIGNGQFQTCITSSVDIGIQHGDLQFVCCMNVLVLALKGIFYDRVREVNAMTYHVDCFFLTNLHKSALYITTLVAVKDIDKYKEIATSILRDSTLDRHAIERSIFFLIETHPRYTQSNTSILPFYIDQASHFDTPVYTMHDEVRALKTLTYDDVIRVFNMCFTTSHTTP